MEKLIKYIEIISGGTPKTSIDEYWNGNIPWLSVKDFSNANRYVYESEKNITKLGLENSATNLLYPNDIIISARGTVGKLALIGKKMAFNQSCFGIRSKSSYLLQLYLYYWFLINVKQLKNQANGGVFDTIIKSTFENMVIDIPTIREQQHIVDTIGSIDDLIESNNDILVRIENQINNIFNKSYNNWNNQIELGKIFTCVLGGTPSTKKPEYWNGDISWINSGEINNLRISTPTKYITKLGLEKSATKLLPKGTTVIAITGATLGQVSLLEIESCANQSVIGILENDTYKKDYIYPLMNKIIKELMLKQTGGAQQHINKNDVQSFIINVPNIEEYTDFSKIVSPLINYQSLIVKQNNHLNILKQKYLNKFFG